jgi:hypothetical protein
MNKNNWHLTKKELEDLENTGRIILPNGNTRPVKLSMLDEYPTIDEKETIINTN